MKISSSSPQVRTGWQSATRLLGGLDESSTADLASLARDLCDSQTADGGWKASADAAGADANSSVLNHVALATYLRRATHAQAYKRTYTAENHARFTPDAETRQQLEACLAKSWKNLTSRTVVDGEKLLGPLPNKVLKPLADAPARVHAALLGTSLAVRMEPAAHLEAALASARKGMEEGGPLEAQPAKPVNKKLLAVAGGAALATAAAVAGGVAAPAVGLVAGALALQTVAGLATGWMMASMMESTIHDKVAHAADLPGHEKNGVDPTRPSLVRRVYDMGPQSLKDALQRSWFGHTKIHHYRTFSKDFVSQFRSPEDHKRVDDYLVKQGREDLIDEEYGATLGWDGYLKFQAVASPSYAVALGGAALLGAGPAFALGFALPVAAYPLFSKEYHRYTHMPADKALAKASAPMGALLKTQFSRFITRHHFIHHVDDTSNFNLMPGADYLRGTAKPCTVAHQEELRRLGVLF